MDRHDAPQAEVVQGDLTLHVADVGRLTRDYSRLGLRVHWGTTIAMSGGKGRYEFQGIASTIEGTVAGKKLTGVYRQPGYPDPIFETGKVEFELSADGKSWKGRSWDKDGNNEMGWDAECVGPYAAPAAPTTTPSGSDR